MDAAAQADHKQVALKDRLHTLMQKDVFIHRCKHK